jgi:PadR family transcriptional regulator, regulatory protein AphA
MSLSYALLGVIKQCPMTGYDLKKFFNDSVNFFWSAQTSQIYRELNALEIKGYVASTIKPSDKGPDKRLYSITDLGLSSLKDWLVNIPDEIDEDNRNAFLLRVFLSSAAGVDELYSLIQKRLEKYKHDCQRLEVIKGKLGDYLKMFGREDEIHYWRITINRGFHDVKSHIEWAQESLDYLKEDMKKNKRD